MMKDRAAVRMHSSPPIRIGARTTTARSGGLASSKICRTALALVMGVMTLAAFLFYQEHERGHAKQSELVSHLVQELDSLKREKDDLSQLLLDQKSKDVLQNVMNRAKAFHQFAEEHELLHTANNTENVRKCLAEIRKAYKIGSIFDYPCGDGSWQKLVPGIEDMSYVGGDLNVAALEKARSDDRNRELGFTYLLFDAVHFPLRRSFDLILFRDVAEQQKIADTLATLDNFMRSNSTYMMMTFWPAGDLTMNRRGLALEAAGWYTPNFLQPPFGFPEPLAMCENDDVGSLHHGQQMLGLWRLSVLRPLVEAARREVERMQPLRPSPRPESRPPELSRPEPPVPTQVDLRDFFSPAFAHRGHGLPD